MDPLPEPAPEPIRIDFGHISEFDHSEVKQEIHAGDAVINLITPIDPFGNVGETEFKAPL